MQAVDNSVKVDPVFASLLHCFFLRINMKKKVTNPGPEVELYTMDFPHAVYKGFIILNKVKNRIFHSCLGLIVKYQWSLMQKTDVYSSPIESYAFNLD